MSAVFFINDPHLLGQVVRGNGVLALDTSTSVRIIKVKAARVKLLTLSETRHYLGA